MRSWGTNAHLRGRSGWDIEQSSITLSGVYTDGTKVGTKPLNT